MKETDYSTLFSAPKKNLFHSRGCEAAMKDIRERSFIKPDLCFSVKVFWLSRHRSLWHWNWFITLKRISPVDFHSTTASLAGCVTHDQVASCIQYIAAVMTEVWLWKFSCSNTNCKFAWLRYDKESIAMQSFYRQSNSVSLLHFLIVTLVVRRNYALEVAFASSQNTHLCVTTVTNTEPIFNLGHCLHYCTINNFFSFWCYL